jgi:hypothetical protein
LIAQLLYAPAVFVLSYFFDVWHIGTILGFLSILHIAYLLAFGKEDSSFYIPFAVFCCATTAMFAKDIKALQIAPLLISVGFLILFLAFAFWRRSIPLEFTKKFRKTVLNADEELFLLRSHNWWIVVLCINVFLHIYFIWRADMVYWAFYSSLGWYALFATALVLNILIGKLLVKNQKNSL